MIEIRASKTYRGPNVWARVPVIHLSLDVGELADRPTNAIAGFSERLTALMPSLFDHECSLRSSWGIPGAGPRGNRGWTRHRARRSGAAEPCRSRGHPWQDARHGRSRRYNVVYTYAQEDVGLAAGKLAVRLINHLVYGSEPDFDFVRELEQGIIRLAERFAYGPSTAAIVVEAERARHPGAATGSAPVAGPARSWLPPEADLGDGHLGHVRHRRRHRRGQGSDEPAPPGRRHARRRGARSPAPSTRRSPPPVGSATRSCSSRSTATTAGVSASTYLRRRRAGQFPTAAAEEPGRRGAGRAIHHRQGLPHPRHRQARRGRCRAGARSRHR